MPAFLMLLMLLTPPCASDDGSGPPICHWNAQTQGDGRGTSFLMVDGLQWDVEIT